MVFYVRTREGFVQLIEMLGRTPSPLWIERDVLSDIEIAEIRSKDLKITQFTVEPSEAPNIDIIRLHHPTDVVWVQF